MTIHDMTAGVMPHHLSARSRFMITDILGGPPQPSPSPDRPRDLSLHHCRQPGQQQQDTESDGHESGTDSAGLAADTSSLGSNGESFRIKINKQTEIMFFVVYCVLMQF
ncbi:hypothetical protein O3M35_003333 [Rhynocoris fuscipes]|uniref:Uncharacterized protein n=1 Tax=Rhynocoris fuscipes TaxID=488301 RepID=A0AAW1CL17_9HEMI